MSQYVFASGSVVRTLAGNAARTETVTGAAVDVRDLEGPLLVVQTAGAGTGDTPTLDGKLQDSADGSTGWADVSGAVFAQVTDAESVQKMAINPVGTRGFLRYVGTIDGTTPSFTVAVILAGMHN